MTSISLSGNVTNNLKTTTTYLLLNPKKTTPSFDLNIFWCRTSRDAQDFKWREQN